MNTLLYRVTAAKRPNSLRVCEMLDDGMAIWRGEWLFDFPKYRNLSTEDLADWENWVSNPGVEHFFDEIIEFGAQ